MAGNDEFAKKLRERFKDLNFNAGGLLDTQFEEEPVPLNVFVEDKGYLGQRFLSEIQYEGVRHIERVYLDGWEQQDDGIWTYDPKADLYAAMGAEFDPYWAEPYRMVNFITMMWGKGSGKDMVSGISALRIAYLLMCLKSPQTYFGMPDSASIHMLNVAATAQQAGRAYFKPIRSMVRKGWFADKCNPMVNAIEFDKNIEAISGNSETESQEGLNLILGVADETDAFKSREQARASGKREAANTVEGILDMMESSGQSRFSTFKNVRISYPRHFGSPIMQLMSKGKKSIARLGDRSPHYISGPYATWDVNPLRKKINFATKYEEDAIEAAAKYECRPQKASTPYFRNVVLTQEAFVPRDHPSLVVTGYRRDGSSWMPEYHFAKDFYPIRGAIYTMHGDLAVNGDKAGIAMAHTVRQIEFEGDADDEDALPNPITEMRPLVQVDFAISFEANLGSVPPREIQLRWARQLAMELVRRGFKIHRYTFDGFQCLSGDTRIPLLNGTTKTMAELEGSEPFWVYSIKDGRVVPGLCTKAWKTAYREDMLEVELDNGEIIKSTSDHRFMLRDGTYEQAGNLQPGESLMPLYRRHKKVSPTSRDYEQVWHPEADGRGHRWAFTHSMESVLGCSIDVLYGRVREQGYSSWKEFKDEVFPPTANALNTRRWRRESKTNHKVVAVRHAKPEWVYDLQVEEHHNFATDAGVFVHNSLDNMQILEAKGIETARISTDRTIEPYKTLRDLMYEGRVMIPEDEKLLNDLLSLNVAFGKIDHPSHGAKDVADAVACAVYNAVDLGGQEDMTGERDFYSSGTFEVGKIEGAELPIGLSLEALGLGEDPWSPESLYAERYERDPFGT